MKKVIITIVMFAISVALIVGVILPLANRGHKTGETIGGHLESIDNEVSTLTNKVIE